MSVNTRFPMKSLWRCAHLRNAPLGAAKQASWRQKQMTCCAARLRTTQLSGTWQPSTLGQCSRTRVLATMTTSSTPNYGQVRTLASAKIALPLLWTT